MRGQCDSGLVKSRSEVVPSGEGYKGVVVLASQGRWETPEAPSREAAQTLLDALNAQLQPKPKTVDGISDQQRESMKDALAAVGVL